MKEGLQPTRKRLAEAVVVLRELAANPDDRDTRLKAFVKQLATSAIADIPHTAREMGGEEWTEYDSERVDELAHELGKLVGSW